MSESLNRVKRIDSGIGNLFDDSATGKKVQNIGLEVTEDANDAAWIIPLVIFIVAIIALAIFVKYVCRRLSKKNKELKTNDVPLKPV